MVAEITAVSLVVLYAGNFAITRLVRVVKKIEIDPIDHLLEDLNKQHNQPTVIKAQSNG